VILGFAWLWTGVSVGLVVALVLAVPALVSVSRNRELSRSARSAWVLIIVLLPILGSLVYFGVRSDW
jgi:hypothetical protein